MRLAGDFTSRADKQLSRTKRASFMLAGLAAIMATSGTSLASADQIVEETLTAQAPAAATYQMPSMGGMR